MENLDAKDLRVGNLLYYRESQITAIDGIEIAVIQKLEQHRKDYFAIPITDELLRTIGFSEPPSDDERGGLVSKPNRFGSAFRVMHDNDDFSFALSKFHRIRLKGIHHLQNIFYFVMEEELDISNLLKPQI